MSLELMEKGLQEFSDEGGVVHKLEAEAPDAIQEVANTLGLEIPQSVKEFYQTYSCISYGSEETLAIDQIIEHYEILRSTFSSMPRSHLPFISDGVGGYYVVVCKKVGKKPDSEFGNVMFVPGCHPFEAEFRSSDFFPFLLSRLEFWKDEI